MKEKLTNHSIHTIINCLYTMQFSEDNLYVTEYIADYHSTWMLSSKNVDDFVEVKFHAIVYIHQSLS